MACTEAYKEHIMYTFNGFCKTVIRFAAINAWRDRSRRRQKEISLEYLTEEKFYPLGTTDEYFEAPYEEYPVTIDYVMANVIPHLVTKTTSCWLPQIQP